MINYHISDKDGERGPFTIGQLRSMWEKGILTSATEARAEDEEAWVPLSGLVEGSATTPSPRSAPKEEARPKGKPWSLLLTIPLLLAVFVGCFHVITGAKAGPQIVRRDSFSFSEFFIDADAITGMPWIAAKSRFPIGCRILQREGLIESDSDFRQRTQRETQERIEEMRKDLEQKLRSGR